MSKALDCTDIAIRLRSHETEGVTSSDRYHLRNEAAAEIDRLRAELTEAKDAVARWYTAAVPYATPSALYDALKAAQPEGKQQ
jgi:hypothetical protein